MVTVGPDRPRVPDWYFHSPTHPPSHQIHFGAYLTPNLHLVFNGLGAARQDLGFWVSLKLAEQEIRIKQRHATVNTISVHTSFVCLFVWLFVWLFVCYKRAYQFCLFVSLIVSSSICCATVSRCSNNAIRVQIFSTNSTPAGCVYVNLSIYCWPRFKLLLQYILHMQYILQYILHIQYILQYIVRWHLLDAYICKWHLQCYYCWHCLVTGNMWVLASPVPLMSKLQMILVAA